MAFSSNTFIVKKKKLQKEKKTEQRNALLLYLLLFCFILTCHLFFSLLFLLRLFWRIRFSLCKQEWNEKNGRLWHAHTINQKTKWRQKMCFCQKGGEIFFSVSSKRKTLDIIHIFSYSLTRFNVNSLNYLFDWCVLYYLWFFSQFAQLKIQNLFLRVYTTHEKRRIIGIFLHTQNKNFLLLTSSSFFHWFLQFVYVLLYIQFTTCCHEQKYCININLINIRRVEFLMKCNWNTVLLFPATMNLS